MYLPLPRTITYLGCLAIGISAGTPLLAQSPTTDRGGKSVSFRQSKVDLTAKPPALDPGTADLQGSTDSENLADQKQSLETEIRFAKGKLEAAQNHLADAAKSGKPDQAVDKIEEEIKTWEARLKQYRSQLGQVEDELAPPVSAPSGDKEVIVPGRNLEIYVVEDPSFNGRYEVRRGGYIILPQVGRISLAGKTIDQAEVTVKRALQASQLQKASVMIEPISGLDAEAGATIYLSGEFQHPRPYKIPAGTAPTLVSVILSSGGLSEKADLTHVKVMRMVQNKGVVEEVNVQQIMEGKGSLASDVTLTEGDVIVVPPGEVSLVYVTGNVKKQGSYKLLKGEKLTAYGVILQSGGFAKFADQKKVHVLRAMPDGTKVKIPVNIVAISRGQQPDVVLDSNDIVVVPEKWFTW